MYYFMHYSSKYGSEGRGLGEEGGEKRKGGREGREGGREGKRVLKSSAYFKITSWTYSMQLIIIGYCQ
jgi:hypothetical protein